MSVSSSLANEEMLDVMWYIAADFKASIRLDPTLVEVQESAIFGSKIGESSEVPPG